MHRRLLILLAALLGAAVGVLPAVAASETTPTVEAVNSGVYYHYWVPSQVTVSAGGAVALSNPTEVAHGVHWVSTPGGAPTCSAGIPVGTTAAQSGVKWSGTCTFTQPGTYTFWCTVHGEAMQGSITVNPSTTTTTTTTGTTTTSGTPPGTPAGPPSGESAGGVAGGGSPLAGSASSAVKLRATQHGKVVHGSVDVSAAGAGGRLEVQLLRRRASLASAARATQVQVGRSVRSSLSAGAIAFKVALDASARRALHAHGRLALTVKIRLSPPRGALVTVTRSVTMRP